MAISALFSAARFSRMPARAVTAGDAARGSAHQDNESAFYADGRSRFSAGHAAVFRHAIHDALPASRFATFCLHFLFFEQPGRSMQPQVLSLHHRLTPEFSLASALQSLSRQPAESAHSRSFSALPSASLSSLTTIRQRGR